MFLCPPTNRSRRNMVTYTPTLDRMVKAYLDKGERGGGDTTYKGNSKINRETLFRTSHFVFNREVVLLRSY